MNEYKNLSKEEFIEELLNINFEFIDTGLYQYSKDYLEGAKFVINYFKRAIKLYGGLNEKNKIN